MASYSHNIMMNGDFCFCTLLFVFALYCITDYHVIISTFELTKKPSSLHFLGPYKGLRVNRASSSSSGSFSSVASLFLS